MSGNQFVHPYPGFAYHPLTIPYPYYSPFPVFNQHLHGVSVPFYSFGHDTPDMVDRSPPFYHQHQHLRPIPSDQWVAKESASPSCGSVPVQDNREVPLVPMLYPPMNVLELQKPLTTTVTDVHPPVPSKQSFANKLTAPPTSTASHRRPKPTKTSRKRVARAAREHKRLYDVERRSLGLSKAEYKLFRAGTLSLNGSSAPSSNGSSMHSSPLVGSSGASVATDDDISKL